MATYDFSKETKNFSITNNGLKVSYSAGSHFRIWPKTIDIAQIQFYEFPGILSEYFVDTANDTITVGGSAFSGNAGDLCDQTRDEVFIAD